MTSSLTFEARGRGFRKGITYVVFIDAIDSHLLERTWRVMGKGKGYVIRCGHTNGKTKSFRLHREILGLTDPNLTVDHIDCNPLNNTRSNLRICTMAENNRNRLPMVGGTSKFKGVSFHRATKKWQAGISFESKKVYLGNFELELDAAIAYNEACIRLHGEFACLNVLDEGFILQLDPNQSGVGARAQRYL